MEQVAITWQRALKIWWSYSWRAFVLMLVLMIPLDIFMFSFMMKHMPKPGAQPDPAQAMQMVGVASVLWPILMVAMIALQAQAMRWMLNKARWSDFRLAVLPRE